MVATAPSAVSSEVEPPARSARWPLLASLVALVGSVTLFLIFRPLGHGVFDYPDFNVYRDAGQRLLDHKQLYVTPPRTLPFTYPPFAAVLSVVFALLPKKAAGFTWLIVNIGLLALVLRLTFRRALDREPRWAMPATLVVLTAVMFWLRPVNDTMDWGQINLLLLALVLVDGLGVTRIPRGVLVGIAAAIKLVPGIFVVYFAVTRQWRAAATAVGSTLACIVAAQLVTPDSSWRFWTNTIFEANRIGDSRFYSNQSLLGLVQRSVSDGSAVVVWVAVLVPVAIVGFWRVRRAYDSGDVLAALAITGLLGCLCSPIAWVHHFVWVIPAIAVLVDDGRDRRRVVLAAIVVLLVTTSLPYVGIHLIDSTVPLSALGWVLENSVGLLTLALVFFLPYRQVASMADEVSDEPEVDLRAPLPA